MGAARRNKQTLIHVNISFPKARFASLSGICLWLTAVSCSAKQPEAPLSFCCAADNDLFLASGPSRYPRYATPLAAMQKAPPGSAVLLLADHYPERTTVVDPAAFALAQSKNLRLFLEYPSAIPGLQVTAPCVTTWERIVVASDRFGASLPRLRILAAHDCHFTPVSGAAAADLVVARVAGYDTALYGLPEKGAFPILVEVPGRNLLVATTRLSGFIRGRYAPVRDWQRLWELILSELGAREPVQIRFQPVVGPAYGPQVRLPRGVERRAFAEAAEWFARSGLLVHPSERDAIIRSLGANGEITSPPRPDAPRGDGSLGILEGFASGILHDGNQPRRLPLRADCCAESAMVFALDGRLNKRRPSAVIASNLLEFVYFNSGMCQAARADPHHGAFGLIGWGDVAPAWLIANYGDDNARAMLATALVAASLESDRWDEPLLRALLANYRTTGKLGFRSDRLDLPALVQNGWKHYHQADTINYSPHFESYLWACNLWAYQQTHFQPLLDRTRTAIGMTMKAYPAQWRWQSNLERARMLLCLAWLVRVEDTAAHREWLNRMAGDLIVDQQPSGAIRERLGGAKGDYFRTPRSNEDYGTSETPLLQQNGDPVSDQLYTTGFALLGLHEAATASGDACWKRAEDRLGEYLCRIQTHSEKFPWLNGTWFRAFDDQRWEAWASSADVGWGAWCIESGWGQAWIAAVLGLRERQTTVWDFTGKSQAGRHFARLKAQMGIED
jgi:hypothetical protein